MNERQHRSTWLHTESSFVRTHPHRPFIQKMVGCRLNAVLFKLHRTGSVGRRLPTSKPFQESGKRRCKCLLSPRVLCCMVCQRDVVLQSTPCSCKLCVCVCAEPTAVLHKKTHPPAPRKPIWTKYPIRGGRVWSAGSYAACAASCILSCAGVCLERGGDYLQGQTGTRVMRPSSSAVDHPAKSIRPGSQCMCRLLGLSQLQESGTYELKFCCSPPTEGSVASCVRQSLPSMYAMPAMLSPSLRVHRTLTHHCSCFMGQKSLVGRAFLHPPNPPCEASALAPCVHGRMGDGLRPYIVCKLIETGRAVCVCVWRGACAACIKVGLASG